ncbi:MAG: hypothetical protein CME64_06170 [Halobacteriovoraceae bacterium]|nr:hypothetical protein [Halobacteriovoraceae bacterium]
MKLGLFFLTILFSLSASASFLEYRDESFRPEDLKNKKWLFNLGVGYIDYPTSLPEFKGAHTTVPEEEKVGVYGADLGVGREFSLIGALSTSIRIGAFYNKGNENNNGKASEDVDVDLANVRTDHLIYGAQASASLNYLFETKYFNIQPFLEFGMGQGKTEIEKEYTFDGVQPDNSDAESYLAEMEEDFDFVKTSVGVNFISRTGIISFIKATKMSASYNEREVAGEVNGSSLDSVQDEFDEATDIYSGTIGMGFFF